jgi:hypothetical protein
MNTSLLKFKPQKKRIVSVKLNADNGNDAEVLAASFLIKAIGAEISWGSRNEDGRKIDLICSYDHPWYESERIIFLVQVKSGDSYGEKLGDGFKLKTTAINLAKRTTHSICFVWIHRDSKHAYWAYIHPRTLSKSQIYGNNHIVSPPMRFDIARCQSNLLPIKKGGAGIILNEKIVDFQANRQNALKKYRTYQANGLFCPTLGNIEVTRIGWRHMFRKTRSSKNKSKSFTTIKYLDKLITDLPSDVYISECKTEEIKKYQYRTSEYVLAYKDAKEFDTPLKPITVIIRLIEEVRWPSDWTENTTLTQFVERRVVLLSCYYK